MFLLQILLIKLSNLKVFSLLIQLHGWPPKGKQLGSMHYIYRLVLPKNTTSIHILLTHISSLVTQLISKHAPIPYDDNWVDQQWGDCHLLIEDVNGTSSKYSWSGFHNGFLSGLCFGECLGSCEPWFAAVVALSFGLLRRFWLKV